MFNGERCEKKTRGCASQTDMLSDKLQDFNISWKGRCGKSKVAGKIREMEIRPKEKRVKLGTCLHTVDIKSDVVEVLANNNHIFKWPCIEILS